MKTHHYKDPCEWIGNAGSASSRVNAGLPHRGKVNNKTAGSTNTQMTHMRDVQNTCLFILLDSPVTFKMGQGHHHAVELIKLLRVYQDAKCRSTKSEF